MPKITSSGESGSYNVNATNIQGVIAGYIQSARKGKNGDAVLTLLKFDSD